MIQWWCSIVSRYISLDVLSDVISQKSPRMWWRKQRTVTWSATAHLYLLLATARAPSPPILQLHAVWRAEFPGIGTRLRGGRRYRWCVILNDVFTVWPLKWRRPHWQHLQICLQRDDDELKKRHIYSAALPGIWADGRPSTRAPEILHTSMP